MTAYRAGRAKALRQTKERPSKGNPAGALDVTHLIRSVQRLEGLPDCFGKAVAACRLDCPWGAYCGCRSQQGIEEG